MIQLIISRAFCETIRMTFGVCVCMCVCVCVCLYYLVYDLRSVITHSRCDFHLGYDFRNRKSQRKTFISL